MGKSKGGNLAELNAILFAELDRLNDSEVTGEQLKEELDRAKGMVNISNAIVSNASLVLKAKIAESNGDFGTESMPDLLT